MIPPFLPWTVGLLLFAGASAEPEPPFQGGMIDFAGHPWEIKKGAKLGPGGNRFAADRDNVHVDEKGRLHLGITQADDRRWKCAEVRLARSLRHGEYRWIIEGDLAGLDPNAVLGLFLYQDDEREIDFELSRWAGRGDTWNAQFAVMPSEEDDVMLKKGRLARFDTEKATVLTVSLRWRKGRVDGRAWSGSEEAAEPEAKPLARFSYQWKDGKEPEPGKERAIMDLWLIRAKPPTSGKSQEIVVRSFKFTPEAAK
jgi:hypothetical protein